jgi:uncharacterized membrane protein
VNADSLRSHAHRGYTATMISAREVAEYAVNIIEIAGVVVLTIGTVISSWHFVNRLRLGDEMQHAYRAYRVGLGRVILLGIELLIVADIIRTVAVEPSLENVAVLGLIVLVRTFLSLALEVELEGRWPWQHTTHGGSEDPVMAKEGPEDEESNRREL